MSRWSDPEACRAVLAAVLLDPGEPVGDGLFVNHTFARASAIVRDSEDFDDPRDAEAWKAFATLAARRAPIDVRTASAELRAMNRLEAVGGPQYLGGLTDEIPTLEHVESHARIVRDCALVRRRRQAHAEAVAIADHGDLTLDETLVALDRKGREASESRPSGAVTAAHHGQAAIELISNARTARTAGRTLAARFGIEAFDGYRDGSGGGRTGGVPRSRVIGVAAPPGSGKTTFVTQAAEVTAEDGGGVLWFSTEIPGREIALRYACQHAEPPVSQIDAVSGYLDDATFLRLAELLGPRGFGRLPVKIYSENLRIEHIAATVSSECARGDVRLVVLDYFQDLEGGRGDGETNVQQDRARVIKSIARDNDVGLLLVSSLTKEAEKQSGKGRATSANLSGAGVRYASDVVIELSRADADADERQPYEVVAAITKHRYGVPGKVRLMFDGARGVFTEIVEHREHEAAPAPPPDDEPPPWVDRQSDAGGHW